MKTPAPGTQRSQFVRMRSDYYGKVRVYLLDAMETVMAQRAKLGNGPMTLEVTFPAFTGTEPATLIRLRKGTWAEDNDRVRTEQEMVRNALARILARFVGAGDDVSKGHAVFEKGAAQLVPGVYLFEVSDAFRRLSSIFEHGALDDLKYRRVALEVVRDNLDLTLKLLQANPDKDLEARVKKTRAELEKTLKSLGQ